MPSTTSWPGLFQFRGSCNAVPLQPAERFAIQIEQLTSMGFVDMDAVIDALITTQGNLNVASDKLLRGADVLKS